MNLRQTITAFSCAAIFTLPATADNWAQWRGPNFNGTSPEKNLPVRFSKTENVAWAVDLPGVSPGTPIIWGDHVFVSSGNTAEQAMMAFCVDRRSGKVLWSHKVADGHQKDRNSNYATPSPTTDGKVVVFFYGNGAMAAFDFAGKELWHRDITADQGGKFSFNWTFSSTPLFYGGKLYLQVLQRHLPSYLLAMDPATGKDLWKMPRDGKAVEESREAFSSPVPFSYQGRKELLVIGCDDLTGHDPETGKELWRWGTWNPQRVGHWRLVPSPAFSEDIILACAPKGDPIYAVKAGGNGTLDDSCIAWKSEPRSAVSSDVPTPLYYLGDFFVLRESGTIARVEPKTGNVKWTTKLTGAKTIQSSPTGADGKIYFLDWAGTVFVVDAGKGEVLSTIPMGEPGDGSLPMATRSSISVSQGQLYIRTNTKLYCVGKK